MVTSKFKASEPVHKASLVPDGHAEDGSPQSLGCLGLFFCATLCSTGIDSRYSVIVCTVLIHDFFCVYNSIYNSAFTRSS